MTKLLFFTNLLIFCLTSFAQDIKDPSVLKKIKEDYNLKKYPKCRKLLMPDNTKISPDKIIADYQEVISEFNSKHNTNLNVPSYVKPDGSFDAWSDPNKLIRMSFAVDQYKQSNGKIMFNPFGAVARGAGAMNSTYIVGKKGDIESIPITAAYFMQFCGAMPHLERYLKQQLVQYPKKSKECIKYIHKHPIIQGNSIGTSPLADLGINIDKKGNIQYDMTKTNFGGDEYSLSKNSKNSVKISKSKSGRFEKIEASVEERGKVHKFKYDFNYKNGKCYLDKVTQDGEVVSSMNKCIKHFEFNDKYSLEYDYGKSNEQAVFVKHGKIDDLLNQYEFFNQDHPQNRNATRRLEEYKTYLGNHLPSEADYATQFYLNDVKYKLNNIQLNYDIEDKEGLDSLLKKHMNSGTHAELVNEYISKYGKKESYKESRKQKIIDDIAGLDAERLSTVHRHISKKCKFYEDFKDIVIKGTSNKTKQNGKVIRN